MAPLILHNVPDDELYIGDDGVRRPYAMVFPHQEGHSGSIRARRGVTETGSFGKSTRRSRSRTGTPARRENPTLAAADKIFSDWVANKATSQSTNNSSSSLQRKASGNNLLSQQQQDEAAPTANSQRLLKSEPTEVILRGYRASAQQYAAVNHYENLAGRICEDYPREPPPDQRRYKGDLRDPAYTRRRALTPEEKVKVNRADGGEHWVKVTFESAEAAETAMYASPQSILGCLVYAEPYRGYPPAQDEPIFDTDTLGSVGLDDNNANNGIGFGTSRRRRGIPFPTSSTLQSQRSFGDDTPPGSHASSQTLDTATLSQTNTVSSATITDARSLPNGSVSASGADGHTQPPQQGDPAFCRKIPTARRATLRSADEAHLPSQSFTARLLAAVPILMWFIGGFGAMIGNEVPRKENGEFDYDKASPYWKFIWWLDVTFRLFKGEIVNAADTDD
ncbi:hypothetical protein SODALDRAFT_322203 [Sodiomyces alkalinus F11]|uniref:Nucleoporin NUP53 n=1 Tax=Sodiomyces alkalinus (strain CBS 110278 / VKM F-3762 / F11) TaxID=1314773 RepID=A0A3N2Q2J3_SODAK|nr:hypothetical protein SODALDRAFT_322203 [Sodiomyces alkalinus F11]ROT40957.1 hypothetical protein SODALDRAFT_322203 [Sodiomyces alkalinus F11]